MLPWDSDRWIHTREYSMSTIFQRSLKGKCIFWNNDVILSEAKDLKKRRIKMSEVKPALVVMAAGMGSRYGGLKQIDPVDKEGHKIIDYSIYDAWKAGFGKVIFIIKKENEADFREAIGTEVEKRIPVEYAFQSLEDVPAGMKIPEGRQKPWGTAQAVLAARDLLDTPFAVINADDFYGREAFVKMCDFLGTHEDDEKYRYGMVGFILKNTLTENGYVSRGICSVDEKGFLTGVTERTHIEKDGDSARYTEDGGKTYVKLTGEETVSMNFWGFTPSILKEMEDGLTAFLEDALADNPAKGEYLLPKCVDELIKAGRARAKVLKSHDRWYGVTYKEDKESVVSALQSLKDSGLYPQELWG